jgi:crossover junction endodeoxyribonuclease RusA
VSRIELVLPLPPSVNHAYANRRGGGRILSREGRQYKRAAAMLAMGQGAQRIHGDVRIAGTIYLDNRLRDLSNCIKLLEDALKGICYADDRQVAHLDLRRAYDRGNPRAEIVVEPYTAANRAAA